MRSENKNFDHQGRKGHKGWGGFALNLMAVGTGYKETFEFWWRRGTRYYFLTYRQVSRTRPLLTSKNLTTSSYIHAMGLGIRTNCFAAGEPEMVRFQSLRDSRRVNDASSTPQRASMEMLLWFFHTDLRPRFSQFQGSYIGAYEKAFHLYSPYAARKF
jgi:hypothetical protein